jgi:short-subunit dehydrogenase
MGLDNQSVAVVTGAASGIGRALALRLAREKISGLALADINAEGLRTTAEMLAQSGIETSLHTVDVADLTEMQKFKDDVFRQHGRVTHLINNAGVALLGNVEDLSVDELRWLMEVNFWGVVNGVKLFLPVLRQQPSAHIINMSSVFGFVAFPGSAAYCASKFAVRGFTEALGHELANSNISVSCVHPGGVATEIVRNGRLGEQVKESDKELSIKLHSRFSLTTAEQAAEVIVRGIRKRSKRIRVGSDAYIIDVLQRVAPIRFMRVCNYLFRV